MLRTFIISFMLLLAFSTQSVMAQHQPSKRCEATTKQGTRCKNQALNNSKYCRLHQGKAANAEQCKAKTRNGTQCTRKAKNAGYCTQHYKMYGEGKEEKKEN
ncbi:MAG: hypothetical protein IJM84_04375 [Bacteroidaceae bacterium]|nr:hypothetical protein [Bacteroidaceae bacterium]